MPKSDGPSNVIEEQDDIDEREDGLSVEQLRLLDNYRLFTNGGGLEVFEDLKATFYDLHSDGMNEELSEIPHPYREYTIKGMRMVIQKIMDTIQIAEKTR